MNVFHIVEERAITNPVTAMCGEKLDRLNGSYVWADQVAVDQEYTTNKRCQACLDSDEYAFYALANAGEGESYNIFSGVTTGRLSSSKPNISNGPVITARMLTDATRRTMLQVQDIHDVFVSPTDYASLEKRFIKK